MTFKIAQLLLAVLLVTAALSAEARLVVRMVQVAHRHGARGPLVVDNASDICGTEYPCGELTGVGIEMLNSVGRFVRARYSNLSLVEEPLIPSTRYNSSVVYTRSTGIQRTIQSATAFLSGLFPDDYFYPVVYSHNLTTDTLLNTDTVPSVFGRRWLEMDKQNAALNPVVDAYFTSDQIAAAAKDAYIEGLCSDHAARSSCASNLYDIATSFEAAGRLPSKSNLLAAMPGLRAYTIAWYRYIYDYNKSVEIDNTQGAASQNLAQTMLANINAHKLSPSFKLYEFSTHDTMLAPLAVTLGDHTDLTMLPPYATTIIVELLQDTESPNDWYVRPVRGSPTRQANGSYVFQLMNLEVHCIDAAGNQYLATTGICPLDGFRRMVDYSRPSVPNGQCTLAQNQYDNMGCPRTVADGKPVPYYCWLYRYVCPQTACPDGYVLGREDLQCYPLGPTTTPAPQPNSSPVPMAWTPRTMDPKKAKDIAVGLLRGVEEGVVLGSAIRKHGE
ncbi:putative histidine secretory acid phosphatase [Leptomonas pyrrhocoris]|uniref:Putative histidine secretory acid phosphatase n=1 Tax=Leptomonas pyrrhocoris TaxID=157538 RepID=A0A0N0DWH7_LEPPY|nr:putative histidine secretory acid phosphatase [Leptomonas pyrrhocoris]KPA81835.1 putative histidine secretory acid phosphatase [Leptomonas pyrrhocoris]|eukprot:XP_015660274.1 putative histidine secretory acid phosphatase [Leptomonas pyrrhocoris]